MVDVVDAPRVAREPATVVVTGASGFIGAELCEAIALRGTHVVGVDSRDDRCTDALVRERLERLHCHTNFSFVGADLRDERSVAHALPASPGFAVVHLAAQAGVRTESPERTIQSNVVATRSLLSALRHRPPRQILFSSSSSVYGLGTTLPFFESQTLGHPASLYAQTKVDCERLVTTFARETGVSATIVRLFNVYGPRMRADLAVSIFAQRIMRGEPVDVADGGRVLRDMTYVEDVVEALVAILNSPARTVETLNVGTGSMVALTQVLDLLERSLGKQVRRRSMALPEGDLAATQADVACLRTRLGRIPGTVFEQGLGCFVEWFLARETGAIRRVHPHEESASRESGG